MTPEAFLIDVRGDVLYRGRINDLYADYGKRRAAPRTHDLRDAIAALLEGREVDVAKTKPVGCYIPDRQTPTSNTSHRDVEEAK